jgi:hypothetical protein
MRSLSDSGAEVDYPCRLSHQTFVCEVFLQALRPQMLLLLLRTSDGDVHLYRGLLADSKDFPYDFVRHTIKVSVSPPQFFNYRDENGITRTTDDENPFAQLVRKQSV